jgi:hypothetical protein
VDYTTGNLLRVSLRAVPVTLEKVNGGFGGADGIVRDARGRLIISDFTGHRIFVLDAPDAKPRVIVVPGIESAADIAISADGRSLVIPDMNGGRLAIMPLPD